MASLECCQRAQTALIKKCHYEAQNIVDNIKIWRYSKEPNDLHAFWIVRVPPQDIQVWVRTGNGQIQVLLKIESTYSYGAGLTSTSASLNFLDRSRRSRVPIWEDIKDKEQVWKASLQKMDDFSTVERVPDKPETGRSVWFEIARQLVGQDSKRDEQTAGPVETFEQVVQVLSDEHLGSFSSVLLGPAHEQTKVIRQFHEVDWGLPGHLQIHLVPQRTADQPQVETADNPK